MDFYFDENFSPAMALALDELEKVDERNRVYSTKLTIGEGVKDPVLIPILGERRGILMTKDKRQWTREVERKLLREHGVSAFYFGTPGTDHWEQMRLIMVWWQRIVRKAKDYDAHRSPHYFSVHARGGIEHHGK